MPLKIIDYGSSEYKQMVALRNTILRKPLGLQFSTEEIAAEVHNIHIAAFEDDEILGCCMLVPISNEEIQLRQMAVLDSLQGKGIGKAILLFAEKIAHDKGFDKIMMHARKPAVGFYEKLGYTISGNEFLELNLPHFIMEKKLG